MVIFLGPKLGTAGVAPEGECRTNKNACHHSKERAEYDFYGQILLDSGTNG